MRLLVSSLVLLLIGCGAEKSEGSKLETSSQIDIAAQNEVENPGPNLEAEARLKPILEGLTHGRFNLSKSCGQATRVYSQKGKFSIGSIKCEVTDITVYLGSVEIEYKVDFCISDENPKDVTFFAFGSNKINSYYLVSDDEIQRQIFICS